MSDLIYAGYYTTDAIDEAEHTYAIAETSAGETVYFGCYGGTAGENNHVPAPLYSAAFLKSMRRSIGKKKKADIFKARCIAQFSHDPEIKTHYDLKPPYGLFGLGDNSGIVYGITGVCHQMCNRVLHAMDYRSKFFNSPGVVWPPSFDLSRILYLNDGSAQSQVAWRSFLTVLQTRMKIENLSRTVARELHETVKRTFIASLQSHLRDGYCETASREIIDLMLFAARPKLDWLKPASYLVPDHWKLLKKKQELDLLLLQGRIRAREYSDGLNACISIFIRGAEHRLGSGIFKEVFGFEPGASPPGVVAAEDMPDIDGYERLGKELKF